MENKINYESVAQLYRELETYRKNDIIEVNQKKKKE